MRKGRVKTATVSGKLLEMYSTKSVCRKKRQGRSVFFEGTDSVLISSIVLNVNNFWIVRATETSLMVRFKYTKFSMKPKPFGEKHQKDPSDTVQGTTSINPCKILTGANSSWPSGIASLNSFMGEGSNPDSEILIRRQNTRSTCQLPGRVNRRPYSLHFLDRVGATGDGMRLFFISIH